MILSKKPSHTTVPLKMRQTNKKTLPTFGMGADGTLPALMASLMLRQRHCYHLLFEMSAI